MVRINNIMSTTIDINTIKASNSLKSLDSAIRATTNAWKANEARAKSVSNGLEASKSRFEGLAKNIENVKSKIKYLTEQQSKLDRTTKQGQEEYNKYVNKLASAEKQLASMTAQQNRAKSSINYYKSGLADAQKSLKQTESVTKSYVERLKAEGKEYEAAKSKLAGYKNSLENLTKQQKIQEQELSHIASESGKSSEAYKRQQVRVNETATSIAKLNNKIKSSQVEINNLNPRGLDKVANAANKIKTHFDNVNKSGERTHGLFKTIFSANVISNAAMSAFGAIKGKMGEIYQSAKQYALEQQTMNATWLTLTNSASKGKAMVSQINQMAVAAQNSTKMVDELSQKFYAINNNAKQTGQLTKAILTLQDAFGQTDAAVENFGTQFSQMMANGKVSAQDMMSIVNTFPKLRPMLLDYERRIHHSSSMTMQEMNKMMSDGKIKSQDMINVVLEAGKKYQKATGNFTKTIPGMTRVVQAQMPVLLSAFTKPLTKMESPIYAAISRWVSSKKTNQEFATLGKTVSTGMNNVMKAFSGSKAVDVTKTFDNAINGINKGLKGLFGWISGHAKDLKVIVSSVTSIGSQIAKSVWKDFASIITTVGNMFGLTAKNSKGSSGAIHVIAKALNSLAKNKMAIKAASTAIVAIATVKGLDRVGGGLFAIGEKGYKAYKNVKALRAGIKGVQGIKDFEKPEQGFFKIGQNAKKAYEWVKSLFGAGQNAGKLTGALKSIHSAGGFKGLSAAGKVTTGVAGAGVVADAGYNAIFKAFQDRHSATKRSQDIGKGIGAGIGGGIGLYFGGPLGAALGSKIGGFIGKWGGEGVNQFTQGWQRQGKKQKLQNWVQWLGFQAHNSFDFFIGLGKKAVTAVGKGFNLAKGFAKKNSKELALTAADPWVGIPALILKNNPKVRGAVNKFVKTMQNGFKNFSKWLHDLPKSMHKGWKQGIEKSHKVMAKFWSDTGKGWNKMWKSINSNRYVKAFKKGKLFQTALKDMRSRFKSFKKWFGKNWSATWKSAQKNWKKFSTSFGKKWNSTWKSANKKWNSFKKAFGKAWSKAWKSFNSNRYVKAFKKGKFFSTALKDMKSRWSSFKKWLGKNWNSFWKSTQKWAKNSWNGTVKNWNGMWKSINSGWKSFKSGFGKAWNSFWKGLGNVVKGAVKTIKDDFTGTINNIIGGFNDVVHAMGGGKKTIGFLHFANGTDWRKKYGTPAIVNDATGKNYREGLIDTDGTVIPFPAKRNLKWWLMPGQEVINGNDMAKMFGHAVHYADGTVHLSRDHKYSKKNYELAKKRTVEDKKALDKLGDKISNALKRKDGNEARRLTKEFNKLAKKYSADKKASKKPDPHAGKVLVDQGLLIGAKSRIGHSVYISESLFKKLIANLNKKKKTTHNKTSRKRATTRRRTTRSRSTSTRRSYRVSTPKISGGSAVVKASVSGLSSINSLAKAIKSVTGKHTATIKVSYSGTYKAKKSIERLLDALGKLKKTKSASFSVKYSGTYKAKKSVNRLIKSVRSLRKIKTIKVKVKYSGTYKAKKSIDRLIKSLKSLNKNAKKSKFGKLISKQAVEAVKSLKGKGNFAKQFEKMTKKFDKDLKTMTKNSKKEFQDMWSKIKKTSTSGETRLTHQLSSFSSKYKHGWSSLESGVHRAFSHFWTNMKNAAGKGVNSVIKVLNSAISKIDSVISDFGGSKTAVHKSGYVHYAGGSDANGRLTSDTLAIVNDASVGPRQEAIVTDQNDIILPHGDNRPMFLRKGWGVLNGTQTRQLGLPHFANGTGLKHLYELAKRNWSHPDKTGSAMFSAINGLTGAMKDLASGMRGQSKNQGVTWWSQLWKMVDDRVNGEGGNLTGLAKHMAKYGHDKPYIWGGESLKGFDCSGLVQYTLAHDYGINLKGRTVGDFWEQVEHIPKSKAKPGDLVFWLPNHHIGAYLGHNQYYSAQSPDSHPNIGVNTLSSVVGEGSPHFGRIRGLSDKDTNSKNVKANTSLQKLIKRQVWNSGFTKTIDEIRDKYGDAGLTNISGSAKAWTSYIKRAAEKMHTHVTSTDIAKIVSMIAGESGGNATVTQKVWDINMANGNPAQGLLQFIPQTFKAFALPGHQKIKNGYDQLLALFNDSNWKNDIHYGGGWGPTGHRRYANGGIVSSPQLAMIGEGRGPETVIPWDISKRSRAYQLMDATLAQFKKEDGQLENRSDRKNDEEEHDFRKAVLLLLQQLVHQTSDDKKKEEHDFMTVVLMLLTQLVNKSNVANIKLTTPNGRTLWEVIEPFSKAEERRAMTRLRRGLSGR